MKTFSQILLTIVGILLLIEVALIPIMVYMNNKLTELINLSLCLKVDFIAMLVTYFIGAIVAEVDKSKANLNNRKRDN